MLSESGGSQPKQRPRQDADVPESKRDTAADFIHDLAESGTANELATVKAASDAVEGDADAAERKMRQPKRQPD